MSCTYLYKNKKVKSYQKLVELISQDDLKEIASVVFSLETKQNLYDELSRLNETCNFKANRNSFWMMQIQKIVKDLLLKLLLILGIF